MTWTPSPIVAFYSLTEANNKHIPQQLNKTADQRNACGGKRKTKRHPPIVDRPPLTLTFDQQHTHGMRRQTPVKAAGLRREWCKTSFRRRTPRRPSLSQLTRNLRRISRKRRNPDQGTYVGMFLTTRRTLPVLTTCQCLRN